MPHIIFEYNHHNYHYLFLKKVLNLLLQKKDHYQNETFHHQNQKKQYKKGYFRYVSYFRCWIVIKNMQCILLFFHKKSKLFFIQYSLEGLRNRIGRIFFRLAKHKIDGIICPNEDVGNGYGLPYCVVPDYIYTGTSETSKTPVVWFKIAKFLFGQFVTKK